MFKKILVANRGEIAVRVIRALRELSIASVAVYSDVDRGSLHVRKADEAYPIGPAAASESYLNIAKILEAARKSGAEAIHPGYGFLSENAGFARACRQAGIKFIGPTPEAMDKMGSKTSARQAMQAVGIPLVPGSAHGLATVQEAREAAEGIGFPIMLKAAAGGGGKGMRLVRSAPDLKPAFEAAKSEALRAFGDDEVYLEKFIEAPRHVEMQVLADEHGHCVYLGERECSVQRRHQKVMEESPSTFVDAEMRRQMGEMAVRVAQAASYTNAGTVEFLCDRNRNFYFLEMNTRLQVEHPITELVTGLDLVHLQIRIAAGEKLGFQQQDIRLRGHAIECRIYAEDPDNQYFPSPGKITLLIAPSGPGLRRDSGMYEGWTVPVDYDPLLAKLIAYGSDRQQCIGRLLRGLSEYMVGGIKTNLSLFRRILEHPEFQAGRLDTGFLDRLLQEGPVAMERDEEGAQVAALAAGIFMALEGPAKGVGMALAGAGESHNGAGRSASAPERSGWKQAGRIEATKQL
jgi:acetyl-CoA carboxylase biotin carboxylase subunit